MANTTIKSRVGTYCLVNTHDRCVKAGCACACHRRPIPPRVEEPPMPTDPPSRPLRAVGTPTATAAGMIDDEFAWEDPPPQRHGKAPIEQQLKHQLAALSGRPGTWARLRRYSSHSGAQSAANRLRKMMGEHWEFRSVRVDSGSVLYGRFVRT